MPQLDLQQEAVLTHLVVCLLLQLLDQPLQKLCCLHILLGIVKVDGVPACGAEQCQGSLAAGSTPLYSQGSCCQAQHPPGMGPPNLPCLALDPLRQVVPHLDGEVLPIERLHLPQGFALELLGLDPHRHGSAPVGDAL